MCLLVVAATRDHPVDHAFVQTSHTTFSLDAARLWRPLDLKNTKSFKTKQIDKTFHFGVYLEGGKISVGISTELLDEAEIDNICYVRHSQRVFGDVGR